jgi:ABC-2 type transport system permease protein
MSNLRTKRFSGNRVMAVSWRVLKQIFRDKRTLGMMIIMPAIIMLIFGFTLGGQVKNVPILVDNQDTGYNVAIGPNSSSSFHFGDNITASLQGDDRVKVTTGSFESGKNGVDNGTYYAAIAIPANFSNSLFLKSRGQDLNTSIPIYVDGTKPQNQASIFGALQTALQNLSGSGIAIDKQFAFSGVELSGLDVSIPSVIAFVLTFLVLLISLIIVSRESTSGILPRLYTTPLSAIERLLGYSIALLLLGIVMVAVILGIGIGVFGVTVGGSIYLLFLGAVLYALAHVFMAVFLSNYARNELQAVQIAPLIALPSMALSGMLIPVNSFPAWVQTVAKFIPMYYGNKIFEGIMLKGYGLGNLIPEFLIISVVALIFFVLAVATVKDRISA